jgi:hypothetical protein
MRLSSVVSLAVLACCIPVVNAPAQGAGVSIAINLGPPRTIVAYSSQRDGEWRASYKQWQPTTMYVVNGQFYDKSSRGARAVVVYHHNDDYFLPPQDKKWVGADKRYNYKRKPKDEDYNRRP